MLIVTVYPIHFYNMELPIYISFSIIDPFSLRLPLVCAESAVCLHKISIWDKFSFYEFDSWQCLIITVIKYVL